MPDIIPSATSIPQIPSLHTVFHPKILSPPTKVLHHEACISSRTIALLNQDNVPVNNLDHFYSTYSVDYHC
ncbi:unnamed protein product [Thelazia callipaeda]|uniref:Ovule protein n=1 Tax=Thelazia callipaeda TaxID=103827 RepID=A0A0N5D417_THECL|nr:unnamed protein product [Thelazia callipaeda]